MQYHVTSDMSNVSDFSCVVAGVFKDLSLTSVASKVDELSGGAVSNILKKGDFKGSVAETLMLFDLAMNTYN